MTVHIHKHGVGSGPEVVPRAEAVRVSPCGALEVGFIATDGLTFIGIAAFAHGEWRQANALEEASS